MDVLILFVLVFLCSFVARVGWNCAGEWTSLISKGFDWIFERFSKNKQINVSDEDMHTALWDSGWRIDGEYYYHPQTGKDYRIKDAYNCQKEREANNG